MTSGKYQILINHQIKTFPTRYAISGNLLKSLGWEPKTKLSDRIIEFTRWMLDNDRWLASHGEAEDSVISDMQATCLL